MEEKKTHLQQSLFVSFSHLTCLLPPQQIVLQQHAEQVMTYKNISIVLMIQNASGKSSNVLIVFESHLGVLEQSILLNAFGEHQAVLAVSGPVQ